MDFAENYSCKSVEEIQTAYWNQTGVTLHPVVVYYRKNGETQHKSYVVVSDEMSHSPSTSGLADTSIPSFLKDFKVSAMFWCLVHKHILLLIKLVVRI
jgi:hypothetical protein